MAGGVLALVFLVAVAVGIVAFVSQKQDSGPHPPGPSIKINGQVRADPGDTVIALKWQAVAGASGYSVYRDGNSVPLNPVAITETRYEDIGLSNGRTYTYAVAIVDAAGKPGVRLPEITVAPKSR